MMGGFKPRPDAMSNSADVAQLYKNVIEEVIKTVRTDFINMGVDEQVLVDLQTLWEQKLIESKVFRAQDFPVTAIREYSTTAGFFYPASSGIRPVYGTSAASMPMGPTYSVGDMAQYPAASYYGAGPHHHQGARPGASAAIPPLPMMRPAAPPQAQPSPAPRPTPPQPSSADDDQSSVVVTSNSSVLPPADFGQYDGADDDARLQDAGDETKQPDEQGEEGGEESTDKEAQNSKVALSSQPSATASAEPPVGKRPRSEDELGSDLDDTDSEAEKGEEDDSTSDLTLCLYEKISRVRTRWRAVLRGGIVHINGADYCFGRANTDFDW